MRTNHPVFGIGITPACAGKSLISRLVDGGVKDHPRMCGEKPLNVVFAVVLTGSPPHVRGKGDCYCAFEFPAGITPACAGKSPPPSPPLKESGDHPRMCGEKLRLTGLKCSSRGSPPHVRGKVPKGALRGCAPGITPACAGKSRSCRSNQSLCRDHPRMCGEKL